MLAGALRLYQVIGYLLRPRAAAQVKCCPRSSRSPAMACGPISSCVVMYLYAECMISRCTIQDNSSR